MNETDEGQYASIDLGTTDFSSVLSDFAVPENISKRYRTSFFMPRIIFPVYNVGARGASLSILDADSLANATLLASQSRAYYYNGATWDRARHANLVSSVVDVAAGTTTILAGTASKQIRIYAASLSLANGSTASKAQINDGANILTLQGGVAATSTSPDSTEITFGPDGIDQPTVGGTISLIVTGTGALGAATIVTGTAE